MTQTSPHSSVFRAGTTLVELLLFLGLVSVAGAIFLPLLFSSSENRLLQQTESLVEQNGAQLMQTLEHRIRHAERILSPAVGFTGAVLALQSGSGTIDPMVVGVWSGSLVMIQKTTKNTLSSPQIAVQNFVVRNTSVASDRPSILLSFRLTRTVRLQAPRIYTRDFLTGISIFPDDQVQGNPCGCPVPFCDDDDETYTWYVCPSGTCNQASTELVCP